MSLLPVSLTWQPPIQKYVVQARGADEKHLLSISKPLFFAIIASTLFQGFGKLTCEESLARMQYKLFKRCLFNIYFPEDACSKVTSQRVILVFK
jgi:hypothetical protein